MTWNFNTNELEGIVRIQDQDFTPDEIAIFFVIYDDNPEKLTVKQKMLLERLIIEGTTPSRRQYMIARLSKGILRDQVKGGH